MANERVDQGGLPYFWVPTHSLFFSVPMSLEVVGAPEQTQTLFFHGLLELLTLDTLEHRPESHS